MAHSFEIYKDKGGKYRARFSFNSEIMFSTQGYKDRSSARNAVESIKAHGPSAPIKDDAK